MREKERQTDRIREPAASTITNQERDPKKKVEFFFKKKGEGWVLNS